MAQGSCRENRGVPGTPTFLEERQKDDQEPLMELTVSVLNNTRSRQLRGAGLIPELLI